MRADRLIAVLLLLQRRGTVTAGQVAAELEISPRTARRDLEALALAGVPVYSSAGRGGGWSLVGGARTDLTGLTAGEAQALFVGLGTGDGGPAARAGIRKLLAALPARWRADAERAADAVLVDTASWGARPRADPPSLAPLLRAVVDGEQVELDHRGRTGATTRVVDPLGLVSKDGTWYLLAGTPAGERTFRLDRVTGVRPTGAPAARPEGFDLRRAWAVRRGEFEQQRHVERTRVLVDPRVLPRLRRVLAHRLVEEDGSAPDGRVPVVVLGPVAELVALELAGFGTALEFADPAARAQLRRLADDLHSRYGSGPGPG
ncbi:Predicted DNA-binding transcriptional regulator YafY, contains an HTH and WYL domains [Klenkia soli]|uniref:Predicted DNA-binding transcriptional regulator YafY, contains an HTH and WYL domains n=1 Tax=Klenkia soli TaxID=1052260 RepID=A0A1H0SW70_9ACTN|nr:WYL domain-containing protein [Klenkia soli]SDP45914.1 Predicted DNA-binding transcriptional regulator YafY, contains an HTH and WYL domains [Klenkia soli]